jgi:hypothetical protein
MSKLEIPAELMQVTDHEVAEQRGLNFTGVLAIFSQVLKIV